MPISPTAEGFRAAFRRPLFTVAEIAWRWVVGATAIVLFLFGFFEFLNTLPVTNGELLFLRTRQPFLVSQAIAHILRGSVIRGMLSLILAALLLAVIWMVAASLGRLATAEAIINYFRVRFRDFTAPGGPQTVTIHQRRADQILGLLRLNFLRVTVTLAVVIGIGGAALVAGSVSSQSQPRPALVFLVFIPIVGLVCFIGYVLNWMLSFASVFAVRDGRDVMGAISDAVSLCRKRSGAVIAVSTWTGVVHLIVFVGASTVVSVPLALSQVLSWRLAALGVLAVTLVYFAVADWLYTVRMAGYICITEMPEALPEPIPLVPPMIEPAATIDREELILSDIPHPVT